MPHISLPEGGLIHFREAGTGRPLLLLHAFPLSAEAFAPQLRSPPRGFRLIAPDLRGFGGSGPATGITSMAALAADALALLDQLGLREPAVVGGVSMGGYAALALARLNPGRVRALVLIDTQASADDDAARSGRESVAREVENEGTEALIRSLLPRLLSPSAPTAVREAVAAMIRGNGAQGAAAAIRGMAWREDARDILARFAGPALVVVGEEDVITPPPKAWVMADLLSNSKRVMLPAAGHLSNLESPDAFNTALAEFCDRLPS